MKKSLLIWLFLAFIVGCAAGINDLPAVRLSAQADWSEKLALLASEARKKAAEQEIENLWNNIKNKDTIEAYVEFLDKYPGPPFGKQAQKRVGEIIIEAEWQKAKGADTIQTYQDFLQKYRYGKFSQQAKTRISELEAEKICEEVKEKDAASDYRYFLAKYPDNDYAEAMRLRLIQLQQSRQKLDSIIPALQN